MHRIHAASVQSGSNGNSIFVRAGGVRILIDAGLSGVRAKERLASLGEDITQIDALIISHDHSDHISSAGIFQRKFGMPIHATSATMDAASGSLGKLTDVRTFKRGQSIKIGEVTVESSPTPHDAVEGSVFVITYGGRRLGVLTDLGHVFDGLGELISGLDAVFLESNYDPRMLDEGPYPEMLKRRIRGPRGHISNRESAELLHAHGRRLKWACLAHLSETNNTPRHAMACHREVLGEAFNLHVASRYTCSQIFAV